MLCPRTKARDFDSLSCFDLFSWRARNTSNTHSIKCLYRLSLTRYVWMDVNGCEFSWRGANIFPRSVNEKKLIHMHSTFFSFYPIRRVLLTPMCVYLLACARWSSREGLEKVYTLSLALCLPDKVRMIVEHTEKVEQYAKQYVQCNTTRATIQVMFFFLYSML